MADRPGNGKSSVYDRVEHPYPNSYTFTRRRFDQETELYYYRNRSHAAQLHFGERAMFFIDSSASQRSSIARLTRHCRPTFPLKGIFEKAGISPSRANRRTVSECRSRYSAGRRVGRRNLAEYAQNNDYQHQETVGQPMGDYARPCVLEFLCDI